MVELKGAQAQGQMNAAGPVKGQSSLTEIALQERKGWDKKRVGGSLTAAGESP